MTGADPTPTIAPRQAANETESESKSTATSEIGTSSYITMSITQTPTPAQTATAGAQTHTYDPNEYGWDVFLVPMSKKEPVFVIDLPEDLTAASVVFNVAADGADFQLPRIIAWAGPSGSEPYYFPGSNYPDPASGGTPAGGYNRRREDTWEVLWDQGFANWTYGFTLNNGVTEGAPPVKSQILMGLGLGPDGDVLYEPDTIGNVPIKVYVEITTNVTGQSDYITRLSDLSPIVGDSTAYGALVFTPILYRNATPEPQYPGYVLPGAELDLPNWDVISNQVINNTNDSVFEHADFPFARLDPMTMVFQTDLSPIAMGLGNSFLQLLASQANWYNASIDHSKADTSVLWQFKNGSRLNGVQWMSIGGEEGFRYWDAWMYLKPNTNYTAWAIAWDGTVSVTSRPVFFMSKSDDFPCSLLPPSDICPGVSYAVPFPNDTDTMITSIPNDLRSSITASLDAFSLSVTGSGIACGRDMYSYVSTCLDCVNAYRDWLCHTLLPRCADANPQPFTNMPNGKYVPSQPITAQRTSSDPRNNATEVSSPPMDYNELLPCIGLCTAVERKCPPGLAWNCPHRSFNADKSYAYIGKNNLHGDGSANTGYPAQDQYGNVWCNDGSSM